jgi:RimJ/RimL family protein N-acetyltransferase
LVESTSGPAPRLLLHPAWKRHKLSLMPIQPQSIRASAVIDTPRLTLRPHRLDDFHACLDLWTDPQVTRFIGGRPSTREETWARLLRYVGHWALLGYGYWVVEEKATELYVGEIGFADFKRSIEPPLEGMPEIGWALLSRAQGKGYATEAVQAAVAWGDAHFGSACTACIIDPENISSIRVAEKCGYRERLRTTYKDRPTVMFVRDRA